MKKRIADLIAWVMALFPVRVWMRFGERNGQVLAAGMSYQALFAVFAAVYVGFSIAGIWLIGQPETLRSLADIVSTAIPGLIGEGGVIQVEDLASTGSSGAGFLTFTGLIALGGLVMTATGWISFARLSVRIVFGLPQDKRNFAVIIGLDLLVAVVLGALLVIAAVLSVASTAALDWVFSMFGVSTASIGYTLLARGIGLVLVLAINSLVLVLMFRFLSNASIRWRKLLVGSVLGGVGILAIQIGNSLLIGGASNNPLLATFAVLIGLLLFFRLTNMVILLAASWIAVGAADRGEPLARLSKKELAAKRAEEDAEGSLLAAQDRVRDARRSLDRASWFSRLAAASELRSAQRRLTELLAAGPPAAAAEAEADETLAGKGD